MKYLIFLLSASIYTFANTTMCYINNITDISTIEDKKFEGGECAGKYSISDMKKQSWNIDDIQILKKDNGFNFIYILKQDKKKVVNNSIENDTIDYVKLNKNMKKQKEQKEFNNSLIEGKRIYNKLCKSCHGSKGELTPYDASVKLNTISLEVFKRNIRDYTMGSKSNGFDYVMRPYANAITSIEVESIYNYLKSINK